MVVRHLVKLALLAALLWPGGAFAQSVVRLCTPTASGGCQVVDSTNPLPTSGGGGGGGDVNLTEILGAAPSATNPLWVSPATGATFPISGSVSGTGSFTVAQPTAASLNATVVGTGTFAVQAAATQSGTWTVQPGNTQNTTAWLVNQLPSSATNVGITAVVSAAAESSHVLKASAGNFYGGYVTSGASAGYLMVFNATSAPADGAVTPVQCVVVPANTTVSISNGEIPGAFSTGITMVFSTTGCFTKTASATAFFNGRVK